VRCIRSENRVSNPTHLGSVWLVCCNVLVCIALWCACPVLGCGEEPSEDPSVTNGNSTTGSSGFDSHKERLFLSLAEVISSPRKTDDWLSVLDPGKLANALDVRPDDSPNGPSFRLRGRIDADSLWIDQNAANRAAYGNLPDTTGLRRARIGAQGNFAHDSRYVAEMELSSGTFSLRDLYATLGDVTDSGEFKFGHMREPFSLQIVRLLWY
jgi:hypothetical protein